MSYQTMHAKPNGIKYVYEATSYWDKELKAPRNKQVCIGRLDEATGAVIPTKRGTKPTAPPKTSPAVAVPITAVCRVAGPCALLGKVAADIGVVGILRQCFPENYTKILSLAYFLVQKGLPLSRSEGWSASHKHPFGDVLPSQRVSELLHDISEDSRLEFFRLWMEHLSEAECFYYDITSVSSYSEHNEFVRWGYNRDKEELPQINLGMLFGQKSALPGYYRRLPGNIPDVSTLKTTVQMLGVIGQTRLTFVLDKGFYKVKNVDDLFEERMRFILACPNRKWNCELFEQYADEITSHNNRHALGEQEVLYMRTVLHKWGNRRCYVHIYYNDIKAAADRDEFALNLAKWKEELTTGNEDKDNVWAYKQYFTVKDLPVRGRKITENTEAVEKSMKKHMGFFCLLTPYKTDALSVIETYRSKESVENCFDDLKNMLDMNRLRVHSSPAMDSRLFIQFIASILLSKVRHIKNQNIKLKHYSVREIMELMETISDVKLSNKRKSVTTEAGPLQRLIAVHFGVN